MFTSIKISNDLLRAVDFAAARLLVPGIKAALAVRGLPLMAACSVEELDIPRNLRIKAVVSLTAMLDSAGSQHALSADIMSPPVMASAKAYLSAFFNKPLLGWLCLATGIADDIPGSTRAGMQNFLHLPTVARMHALLRDVRLIDLRVIVCLAWIVLHELGLAEELPSMAFAEPEEPDEGDEGDEIDEGERDVVPDDLIGEPDDLIGEPEEVSDGDEQVDVSGMSPGEFEEFMRSRRAGSAATPSTALQRPGAMEPPEDRLSRGQLFELLQYRSAMASSKLAQSEAERVRLAAVVETSTSSQVFFQQESSRLAGEVAAANRLHNDELARRMALEAIVGAGVTLPSTSSPGVLDTLLAIKTSLATKSFDLYECPKVLFLKAVMAWLELGRFVDPHMLCPSYLLSLEIQTPTKDEIKLRHSPYLRFHHRDPCEWLDGCAKLENIWASLDTHRHLVGSLAPLRDHMKLNVHLDDSAIIGITKDLMKQFPDPRTSSWLQELQKNPSRVFTAMMYPVASKRRAPAVAPPLVQVKNKKKKRKGNGAGAGGIPQGVGVPPKYNNVCFAYSTVSTTSCKFGAKCRFGHTCVSCGQNHMAHECPSWDPSKDSRP